MNDFVTVLAVNFEDGLSGPVFSFFISKHSFYLFPNFSFEFYFVPFFSFGGEAKFSIFSTGLLQFERVTRESLLKSSGALGSSFEAASLPSG